MHHRQNYVTPQRINGEQTGEKPCAGWTGNALMVVFLISSLQHSQTFPESKAMPSAENLLFIPDRDVTEDAKITFTWFLSFSFYQRGNKCNPNKKYEKKTI